MSTDFAVRVRGLSKCFSLYASPVDRLRDACLSRFGKKYHREFPALTDVGFSIQKGDSVGIIGRNGSGKSTLLQTIVGTLQASTGTVEVEGRVAALLELGSGFNLEFTGRENVYMNASILGLSKAETDARFEDIVAFADIGDFIDQPVRAYSSGMMLRLAFAVQVQVQPDVLIIDEALAVGDELFQRKCFAALSEFHRKGGTLLFVSHVGAIVKELCQSVILLDDGEMVFYTDSKTGVDEYHRFLFAGEEHRPQLRRTLRERYQQEGPNAAAGPVIKRPPGSLSTPGATADAGSDDYYDPGLASTDTIDYPCKSATISDLRIERVTGGQVNHLVGGRRYRFACHVTFLMDATNVMFSMMVKSRSGLELGGSASGRHGEEIARVQAGACFDVAFEFTAALYPDVFFLNCGVNGYADGYNGFLARIVDAVAFRVLDQNPRVHAGYVDFDIEPRLSEVSETDGEVSP